ncbi:MAG TPA: DUF1326 domain-containing protein [Dehalococcoidia bacterium]|nr:DUF1326 domain-containing protein [Dehalococcoidia bacterium]
MAQAQRWTLVGDYFENCNCDVVCPCEVSPLGVMRAPPTQGHCDVFLAFHVDSGTYGDVALDGLNFVVVVHAPGAMAEGDWTVAAYLDERASPQQREALGAILSGHAGGPFAALGPLISRDLGAKVVPIQFRKEGRRRSVTIPGILDSTVEAVPGADPEAEVVKRNAHPFFPEAVQAYGVRTTYSDHGLTWDNTGKNADYASFRWSGP